MGALPRVQIASFEQIYFEQMDSEQLHEFMIFDSMQKAARPTFIRAGRRFIVRLVALGTRWPKI